MTLLANVKTSLRITTSLLDDELLHLIDSSKLDLIAGGVPATQVTEQNPLIVQAIIQYCKINCTSDTPDKTVINLYEALKKQLSYSTTWWIPGDDS